MKRFGQWIAACCAAAACVIGTASAQPAAAPDSVAVAFTVGPTFGHTSSISYGGEVDYKIATEWEVFFEIGYMKNVATSFTDDRAQSVATTIGGSADVATRATYFNAGAKYRFVPFHQYQPYAILGFGAGLVEQDNTFSVNNVELTEAQLLEQYGVQLGSDLAGSTTRPMFVIGAGASRSFMNRYFVDVSYRYGRIFAKGGTIEDDEGVNTNRLQFGFGVRF